MMHEPEKSDSVIVAAKPTNKAERSAAEPGEPRTGTEGNVGQQSTCRAQARESVSQALGRVRQGATTCSLSLNTQGRSRMPELGTSGSVRGARGNPRPDREKVRAKHTKSNCDLDAISRKGFNLLGFPKIAMRMLQLRARTFAPLTSAEVSR